MNSNELKCEVCGEKAEGVYASITGAFSLSYCKNCALNSYEPYGCLVAMGVKFDELNPSFKSVVENNLKYHKKTIEEFDKDVQKMNDELYESMCKCN